jgi:gamma-carbonic anhydrase
MEKKRMGSPKVHSEEMNVFPYKGIYPRIDNDVFIAPGVKIIGDVMIGQGSSIWYNSVVRGDVNYITIGKDTNIQDLSMLHVTNGKYPLIIGDKVTVGHSVTLHGCIVQNLTLIGMGSVILDGAVIEEKSIVAAGAVIRPGYIVPSMKLVGGIPGKIIRSLTDEEMIEFEKSALRYKEYSLLTINSLRDF